MTVIKFTIIAVLSTTFLTGNAVADRTILVQSTTSTKNSGLYDHILPLVKQDTGVTVNVVAVGTGAAIKNAMNCDGDVLLVHSRKREDQFVAGGYSKKRYDVMYNDFVVVGPNGDPAGIAEMNDAVSALKKIAATKSKFASRGDDSGTHKKEMDLWKIAGFDSTPSGQDWYTATGQGMSATLTVARQTQAYTLTDKGTWLATSTDSGQVVLIDQEDELLNVYSVILLNLATENINHKGARAFRDFMLSIETQNMIEMFGRDQYGESLFYGIN